MFSSKDMRILGLSQKEVIILSELSKNKSISVTTLGKHVGLPRTTTHFILEKLLIRGFASKVKVKNHIEWTLTSAENLGKKLESLSSQLTGFSRIIGSIETKDFGIVVYKGEEKTKEAYEKILNLTKGERIYLIQGNKSAEDALKRLKNSYILNFHHKFKKSGVIIETVIGRQTLNLFKNLDQISLKSHQKRLIVTYVVPDEYMNFDVDLLIMRNKILVVNNSSGLAIIISNRSLVLAIKSLFYAVRDKAQKLNLNEYLEKLIVK